MQQDRSDKEARQDTCQQTADNHNRHGAQNFPSGLACVDGKRGEAKHYKTCCDQKRSDPLPQGSRDLQRSRPFRSILHLVLELIEQQNGAAQRNPEQGDDPDQSAGGKHRAQHGDCDGCANKPEAGQAQDQQARASVEGGDQQRGDQGENDGIIDQQRQLGAFRRCVRAAEFEKGAIRRLEVSGDQSFCFIQETVRLSWVCGHKLSPESAFVSDRRLTVCQIDLRDRMQRR